VYGSTRPASRFSPLFRGTPAKRPLCWASMALINENYRKLQAGYLFPEIARRVGEFSAANPDAAIIRLGIGDITLPLAPAIVEALRAAADEMGRETGVHGYGPENGYDFLIEAICEHDYKARGVEIATNEVFVSDGSKQDSGNIQEIFGSQCKIAVTDPSYPVYVDTNVMAGRTGNASTDGAYEGLRYLPATEANRFAPPPPEEPVDLVYLCSPNNPTGSVASRENLASWVSWARKNDSILIFDAAYDAFIQTPPTTPSSRMTICPIRFTKSMAPASARSKCAAIRNARASPVCAVRTPWYPDSWKAPLLVVGASASRSSGRGAKQRSSTVSPTWCSERRPPYIRPTVESRRASRSRSTCAMQ